MQRAMCWKLYSKVIDLFIPGGSRQQFNIITFPKGRVMQFRMSHNQSYFFARPNDTIMRVCFMQPFNLVLVDDEFLRSRAHSFIQSSPFSSFIYLFTADEHM